MFNPRPTNPTQLRVSSIQGYSQIGAQVAREAADAPVLAIDSMWGADWAAMEGAVAGALSADGRSVVTVRTCDCLRPPAELRAHFQPWLTENPVFGVVCDRPLSDYFDLAALRAAVQGALARGGVVLVTGPFAIAASSLAGVQPFGLYCDLAREEIIRRQASGQLRNLGDDRSLSAGAKYKHAYYVEWPVLEGYKRSLLAPPPEGGSTAGSRYTEGGTPWASPVRWYIDCGSDAAPVAVSYPDLVALVRDVASRPLRCKPFFMPGVWGGQRLKEVADLPQDWPNCAWDFEIVFPENAVPVGLGGATLTLPFHLLLWLQAPDLMGELIYRQFGDFFPLRINYLDTIDGTNLSLQVHPHHTYMRQNFGEPIGQDESYYIVEREPGARVYLGLKDGARPEALREAVRKAESAHVPFEITDYVNGFDANVGDLFLIPAGTVHCSGAGNLVLEISTTPYWYTFKIYDYLRPDLDGKPRPINSAHAFQVIDFTRTTDWVKRHLIPQPVLLRQEAGGAEYHIGSATMTFYGVNRLEIQTEMADETGGGFLLLTPVRGDVQILAPDRDEVVAAISYLETFVVPASFGRFRLRADGAPCQVVKTYVRR